MRTRIDFRSTAVQHSILGLIVTVFVGIGLYAVLRTNAATTYPFPASRDMYRWPLSRYAPQNMPIGKNANYQPANITKNHYTNVTADDDIIYYNPNAPLQDVYYNGASWNENRSRCNAEGGFMHKIRIPADFLIPDNMGSHGKTPNHSASLLDENGKVVESQPLTHCPGGPFTTLVIWDGEGKPGGKDRYDLNSAKFGGAHGGSGISGAGLALKVGEFTPNNPPRHAIGIELHAMKDYSCSGECKRWPAPAADNYAGGGYQGSNPKVKPGSLLALKQGQGDSLGLQSEPGKMLAWVMENYGAYIVDDAYWEAMQIPVEFSPNGDFKEEFKKAWGVDFAGNVNSSSWHSDVKKIFEATWVIDNNGPNSIGGGGDPLQCYAPPFNNGTDSITTNPNGAVTEPSNCGDPMPTTNPTTNPTANPTTNPTTNPTSQPSISDYDANIDGQPGVGVGDLTKLITNYGKTNATRLDGDLSGDGIVNVLDLSRLIKHWGKPS